MMKCVQAIKKAEPECLEEALILSEIAIPEPKQGEVRIKVVCTALNPVDWKQVKYGLGINSFPHILGLDTSGIVDKIGEDTECAFKVGDRVVYHGSVSQTHGGYAEFSITTAHSLCGMPKEISFADAAAIPCAGYTAYQSLVGKMNIQKGQNVVIAGAAGGVGGMAVQIANYIGCNVIAICSGKNAEAVKKLGAHHIIDYTKEDVYERVMEITAGVGAERWLDGVSPASGAIGMKSLAFQGQLVTITGKPDPIDEGEMFTKAKTLHYQFLGGAHGVTATKEPVKELVRMGDKLHAMYLEGKLNCLVTEEVSLEEVCEALKRNSKMHVRGKVICRVCEDL
eukprot:TRINITY_DN775960_c0_g1_i1.p1 TRINITY_DN775960_c0_g1~~TRINITY_DN775960_c0_g1_i1.p1  ORF type:complete len:339 (-),score=108.01 TRINITY_DN775960_c0_g1_i1:313-1329(-)